MMGVFGYPGIQRFLHRFVDCDVGAALDHERTGETNVLLPEAVDISASHLIFSAGVWLALTRRSGHLCIPAHLQVTLPALVTR